MKPITDSSAEYEVERRDLHAERPGFRISELQISSSQTVPWHFHRFVDDTFYVLNGRIRVSMREPDEDVVLGPGETRTVGRLRPHSVANAGPDSATFLILQGIGQYDYVPVTRTSELTARRSDGAHEASCDEDRRE